MWCLLNKNIRMFSLLIPQKVTLNWSKDFFEVNGPLGTITKQKGDLSFAIKDQRLYFLNIENNPKKYFYLSLMRSLFLGVSKGYHKKLRLIGVGFKAFVVQKKLNLKLGFSHEVIYDIPNDIDILTGKTKGVLLFIRGKELGRVCQVAAEIKALRFPDVYKGKGIHYDKEIIKLKKGKREGK